MGLIVSLRMISDSQVHQCPLVYVINIPTSPIFQADTANGVVVIRDSITVILVTVT